MIWTAFVLIPLHYSLFALYYKILFPARGKRRIVAFGLTVASLSAVYITLNAQNLGMFNMPVFTIMIILSLRCITSMNWLQAVYGGLVSTLSTYCARGIFSSLGAMVSEGPVLSGIAYSVLTTIAFPVCLVSLLIMRRKVFSDQRMKTLLYSEGQLKLIIGYGIAATVGLTIMHSGRYVSQHNVWYPVIALSNYVLTFGVLVFTIFQSIRSIELLVYRERSQMLEQQYVRQLSHYKSYQNYTESFHAFLHDYRAMMGTAKSLMRSGEVDQAIQLIDAGYDEAQKKVRIHKQYSDNAVLDAMLQDLANLCNENEIRYSFQVHAPRNTRLTLLDAIRIFSNITTNAVEACMKLPAPERYIRITSRSEQQWAVLEVTNTYNGERILRNGKPVTTKAEPESHGFGLSIVSEIVETLGGFILYDVGDMEADNRSFSVRLFVPQSEQPAA